MDTKYLPTFDDLALDPGEHGAIIGRTGSGKSFLAERLIRPDGNLGIIDPKRKFKYDTDVTVYSDASKLLRHRPPRFIYRPDKEHFYDTGAYGEIYDFLLDRGKGTAYTDDLIGIMNKQTFPQSFGLCYGLGRELELSMISTFHRPTWVPMFCISEISHFYIFNFNLPSDLKRIAEMIPGYDPLLIRKYRYSFAFYDQVNAQMDDCVRCRLNLKRS